WSYAQPKFDIAVVSAPIVRGNLVYLSNGYKAGCNLLQISGDARKGFQAKELYKTTARRIMENQHGGGVLVRDCVYGYSDARGGSWVCQDLKTGAAKWSERDKLGKGSLTCADGQLYLYSEDEGAAVLIEASPDGWKESGRFEIPKKSALPQTRKSS